VCQVGDAVGQLDDLALQGARHAPTLGRDALSQFRVAQDAVADLLGQVQAAPLALQVLHHPNALLVVTEVPEDLGHRILASVPERRVPEVVREAGRLSQVLVQAECPRDRPRDLRHLHRVRQARAIVVALRRDEDLGLVLQAAERLAVDDPVPVALVRRPQGVILLRPAST
jgi:hypothetical protein